MYSSALSLTSARIKTVQVPINRTETTSYLNNIQIVFSNKIWNSCVIILGRVTEFVKLEGKLEEDRSIRNLSDK
jgi:hypothetical protein